MRWCDGRNSCAIVDWPMRLMLWRWYDRIICYTNFITVCNM